MRRPGSELARVGSDGRLAILVALIAGLLAGCSTTEPYPDIPEKNLLIRTEAKSGSAFSTIRAALGVHRVDERCRIEYEGTVSLDQPLVSVGIPVDRPSYLVFAFASSTFLGGSRSSISRETLLTPRAGHRYDVDVSYKEDIYHVVIRERRAAEGKGREIELRDLRHCAGR